MYFLNFKFHNKGENQLNPLSITYIYIMYNMHIRLTKILKKKKN